MGQTQGKKNSLPNDETPIFHILWLDAQVNNSEHNQLAQQDLRKMDKNLRTFSNQEECYKCILSTLSDDQIMLIVSGQLGKEIVPRVHQLPQIKSIFIFCWNPALYEQWATSFDKVKEIVYVKTNLGFKFIYPL